MKTQALKLHILGISGVFATLLLLTTSIVAQPLPITKYWLGFKDKAGTPYTTATPEAFLSAKAIERRQNYNISLTESDLPVSPQYVQALQNLGIQVLYTSKWLNGAVVYVNDSNLLAQAKALPFVLGARGVSNLKKAKQTPVSIQMKTLQNDINYIDSLYYGTAFRQIQMLNGDYLHAYGFDGEGMTIAILDAGFSGVDTNPAFQTHFANGQIKGVRDFVDFDGNVYAHANHGAQVFSILGANLPGSYVGAAPAADVWLIRTEDGQTETLIEEYNWVAGAELADSVGADIINSSLGYSQFDYQDMNYTYDNMDGNTAISTRGADMAAAKGILVVNSAGNSGNKPWHYITAPADADSILAVGAVDSLGNYAFFSSTGPSSDGNVKPNVAAQGLMTAYVDVDGTLRRGNGTSFSSPIIAGMVACLWQANRSYSNMDIIRIVEQSSSQAEQPDSLKGFGIPDFYKAMKAMGVYPSSAQQGELSAAFAYPNPFTDDINVYYYSAVGGNIKVTLFDLAGKKLFELNNIVSAKTPYRFSLAGNNDYAHRILDGGMYILQITDSNGSKNIKVIKE